MSKVYTTLEEQVRILRRKGYCPRCRTVAAQDFLSDRIPGSLYAADATEAYRIMDNPATPEDHTFTPGSCNASQSYRY